MNWISIAHLGGILFVITILASVLFVVVLIINDGIQTLRRRHRDAQILKVAEEARSDFD